MNETVLESLVVRLVGDSSSFMKMVQDATSELQSFAKTATQTLASIAEFAGFRSSLNAFTDFQDNLTRIETTVKANGLAVEQTMKDYAEFANQIEETTRVSATAATGLLAVAHSFDLVGEKAQKAVRLAIGISQGRPGVSAQSVIQALSQFWRTSELSGGGGKGGRGSSYAIYSLASLLGIRARGLGGGKDAGEAQAKLMEEINKQLKIAEEVSDKLGENFSGQLARIKNYLQDIGVELGGIVAKWLKPFVDQLQKAVKWFKQLGPEIKQVVTAIFALATVLTVGGPIVRFFLLLGRLAASISPVTLALTAAAAATAFWVQSVGGLGAAWEIVRGRFLEFVTTGVAQLRRFIMEHKELTIAVALGAAAIGTALLAYRVLATVIATVNGIIDALYIKQILSRIATVAWTVVLIAAHLAMQAFAVGMIFWKAATTLITFSLAALKITLVAIGVVLALLGPAWLSYNIGVLVSKAIMIAFNAVLAMSWTLLTAGFTLLVAAGLAAFTFGFALGFATTALTALYGAGVALIAPLILLWDYMQRVDFSLANIMNAIPPLKVILPILGEWLGILKSILQAMTVDMNLAWQLVQAGSYLAYLQIRNLWPSLWKYITDYAVQVWPPVWDFIKEGFSAIDYFIVKTLVRAFLNAAIEGVNIMIKFFGALTAVMLNPFKYGKMFKGLLQGLKIALGGDAQAELENALKKAMTDLQAKMANVQVKFGKVVDTPEIIEARKRVKDLQDQIGKAAAAQKKGMGNLDLGAPFKEGTEAIKKWEAVLVGSAEGYSRIQEYYDKINEDFEKSRKQHGVPKPPEITATPVPAGAGGPGGGGGGGKSNVDVLLEKMIDMNAKYYANPRDVRLAGLKFK